METVVFVPDLTEYAFVGVSLSDAKFMGEEYSNQSHNLFYYRLHSSNYWHLHPLCNAPKKHVLHYFTLKMAAIMEFATRRRHRRDERAHGRRERIFSTCINLFEKPEEHIIRSYHLPSHVIFNLLQKLKDDLEPSTGSHAIPALSKLLATLYILVTSSFQSTVASLFLYFFFICNCATLLVNHPQKFPLPSALFWNCAVTLICPVK